MQLQQATTTEPEPTVPTLTDDVSRRMLRQRRVMLTGPIDGPLAEVEPGGLGIQLIRSFIDDLRYERAGRGNRVHATIRLP